MYRQEMLIVFSHGAFEKATGLKLPDGAGGCVHYNGKSPFITLWVEMDEDGLCSIPDMTHEVFHACDIIADNVGLVLSERTGNEHFAYLTGWVMEAVMLAQAYEKQLRGLTKPRDTEEVEAALPTLKFDELRKLQAEALEEEEYDDEVDIPNIRSRKALQVRRGRRASLQHSI